MIVRLRLLRWVALGAAMLMLFVQAMPVAAQDIAPCRVQTVSALWSFVGTVSFDRCSELVGSQVAARHSKQVLGTWDGYWVSVDNTNRVYWSNNQRTWNYAGVWDDDSDSIANSLDQCPQAAETVNRIFDSDGCPDSINDLVTAASNDLDSFWQSFFAATHQYYVSPGRPIAYFQPVAVEGCGQMLMDNAFYCAYQHTIFYDAHFLNTEIDEFGDYAAIHVLAHEWGHAIQGLLNEPTVQYSIARELQADCFAGAYAAHAQAAGYLETGDVAEAAGSLMKGGDRQGTPWFDPQAHGSANQRIAAFARGWQFGASQCIRDY